MGYQIAPASIDETLVLQNRFSPFHDRLTAYCPVTSKVRESRLLRLPWNVLSYCAVRCMSFELRQDQVRVVERGFDANQFGKLLQSNSALLMLEKLLNRPSL